MPLHIICLIKMPWIRLFMLGVCRDFPVSPPQIYTFFTTTLWCLIDHCRSFVFAYCLFACHVIRVQYTSDFGLSCVFKVGDKCWKYSVLNICHWSNFVFNNIYTGLWEENSWCSMQIPNSKPSGSLHLPATPNQVYFNLQ